MTFDRRTGGRLLMFAAALLTAGCQDKIAPWTAASTPTPTFQGSQDAPLLPITMPAVAGRAHCAADAVDGVAVTPHVSRRQGDALALEGWVATSALHDPGHFDVVLDGVRDYGARLETNAVRSDVAATLNSPKLASAGFRARLELEVLPGRYALLYLIRGSAGAETCPLNIEIQVG